jgi:hypothetical protein
MQDIRVFAIVLRMAGHGGGRGRDCSVLSLREGFSADLILAASSRSRRAESSSRFQIARSGAIEVGFSQHPLEHPLDGKEWFSLGILDPFESNIVHCYTYAKR